MTAQSKKLDAERFRSLGGSSVATDDAEEMLLFIVLIPDGKCKQGAHGPCAPCRKIDYS